MTISGTAEDRGGIIEDRSNPRARPEFDIDAHFDRFEAALVTLLRAFHMDAAMGLSAEDLAESVISHFAVVRVVVDRVQAK